MTPIPFRAEQAGALLHTLRHCGVFSVACRAHGLHEKTVRHWMKTPLPGEASVPGFQSRFEQRVCHAVALFQLRHLQRIAHAQTGKPTAKPPKPPKPSSAAAGASRPPCPFDWRASAWLLQKVAPETYGGRETALKDPPESEAPSSHPFGRSATQYAAPVQEARADFLRRQHGTQP